VRERPWGTHRRGKEQKVFTPNQEGWKSVRGAICRKKEGGRKVPSRKKQSCPEKRLALQSDGSNTGGPEKENRLMKKNGDKTEQRRPKRHSRRCSLNTKGEKDLEEDQALKREGLTLVK